MLKGSSATRLGTVRNREDEESGVCVEGEGEGGLSCLLEDPLDRVHLIRAEAAKRGIAVDGYRIDTPNDKLPAVVHGGGPKPGPVTVSVDDSSQFAR